MSEIEKEFELDEHGFEAEGESELPPSSELTASESMESDELSQFEAAQIEEQEFVENDRLLSILESLLFASDRPVTIEMMKSVFKSTNIKTKDIRRAVEELARFYADSQRGVSLEEINGGYQLRTKLDNMDYMKRHVKGRSFRLSGPALEVLSIVAYKQPTIKADVDEIRGVESGHLMRALMDRGLIRFAGKSELPGKPMLYETTRKFLEIFGLRNIKELPSLSEIDELLPDGIGETEEEKQHLSDITGELSVEVGTTYSDGETELTKITEQLSEIHTSSDFFEQEKARQKRKRDEERAQDIREAMILGHDVPDKDIKWLKRFEEAETAHAEQVEVAAQEVAADAESSESEPTKTPSESEQIAEDEIYTEDMGQDNEGHDLT